MNESFSFKRFVSIFEWSSTKDNLLLRIFFLIFFVIQQGWLKSKSDLNSIDFSNLYITSFLLVLNVSVYHRIIKRGIDYFLLLPATVFEKFSYAFTTVFIGSFAFSFVMFTLTEMSSRLFFSVSHQWFALDLSFAIWIVFTTSILFFIQFLLIEKLKSMALIIVVYVIIVSANIFIDNYFIEHFAQYTSIRLALYSLLSGAFIGAAYLQFVKCEATFQTKTSVLK
ncbi:MAG: hypothetical protein KA206_03130 [Paludibacter sp.]|nr:hypothetical protein [Paludibacter sp.]